MEYIVIGFPGQNTAKKVMSQLRESGFGEMHAKTTAVIARNEESRILVLTDKNEMVELATVGAIGGGLAGLLIGTVLANPLVGLIAGGTIGAIDGMISGDMGDQILQHRFVTEVGDLLDLDSSAICFLVFDDSWQGPPEGVRKLIDDASGKLLRTTMPEMDRKELEQMLQSAGNG